MVRSFMAFVAQAAPSGADEDGEPVPPGKELAIALAQGVSQHGFTLTENVDDHNSYGWYFVVRAPAGQRVWCMLQETDEWLVITEPLIPILKRIVGQRAAYEAAHQAVCNALDVTARANASMTNIRWFTRQEFESQASTEGRA
jgi:hypothetical protein